MTTEATALNRYNRLFNNDQYSAIAAQIVVDLRVQRDSVRVSDCMNEITNTSLSLCNIREKLQSGAQRISGALHQAICYSERPEMFELSDTVFPRNNPD